MKKFCFGFILLAMMISIDAVGLDSFHCKAATCHEFYYGLQNFPRRKEYVNVCHHTVRSFLTIPQKYGKCVDKTTEKMNPLCIIAVANTIKNCINGLEGVPKYNASYHCGHRLMQNCGKLVGLDRFPFNSEYQQPTDDV